MAEPEPESKKLEAIDSDSSSDSDSEEQQPTEWLATSRAKRSTAGQRMTSLIQQEAEADDDLELLFAEGSDDEGFEFSGDDADDVQMDSSDDDEDKGPAAGADDLEGEKELIQKERQERMAKKRKTDSHLPKGFLAKRAKVDQSKTPPRPKKKSERASWIPTADDAPIRASDRRTTKASKEQLYKEMQERERKRLKQLESMERAAAKKAAMKKPEKTQVDRLAEAARVEKQNAKSLNRWEEAEKIREEEAKARLAALHNRTLEGPVITYWSGKATWIGDRMAQVGKVTVVEEKKPKPKTSRKSEVASAAASRPTATAGSSATPASQPPSQPSSGPATPVAPTFPSSLAHHPPTISVPPTPLSQSTLATPAMLNGSAPLTGLSAPPTQPPTPALDKLLSNLGTNTVHCAPHAFQMPAQLHGGFSPAPSTSGNGTPGPFQAPAYPWQQPPSTTQQSTTTSNQSGSLPAANSPFEKPAQPALSNAPSPAPQVAVVVKPMSSMSPQPQAPFKSPSPMSVIPPYPKQSPSSQTPMPNPQQLPVFTKPTPSPSTKPLITIPPYPKSAVPPQMQTPLHPPQVLTPRPNAPYIPPFPGMNALPQAQQPPAPPPPPPPPKPVYTPSTRLILTSFSDTALRDKSTLNAILSAGNRHLKPTKPPTVHCCITGKEAKYRDPKTGLPYANAAAYKEIQKLARGEYRWSDLLGAYGGQSKAARGVPDRFVDPNAPAPVREVKKEEVVAAPLGGGVQPVNATGPGIMNGQSVGATPVAQPPMPMQGVQMGTPTPVSAPSSAPNFGFAKPAPAPATAPVFQTPTPAPNFGAPPPPASQSTTHGLGSGMVPMTGNVAPALGTTTVVQGNGVSQPQPQV